MKDQRPPEQQWHSVCTMKMNNNYFNAALGLVLFLRRQARL